jgi:hypothetical protein
MAKKAQRRQAKTEGRLRYGPQKRLLRQMLRDVSDQFTSGLAGEESAYRALVDSAKHGIPQMSHIYDDAAGVASRALTPAAGAPDLNALGLGAGAAPFLGAASRDASATQERLATMLQASNAELVGRQQQAAAGRAFAVGKLASDAGDQASKIRQQLSGISAIRARSWRSDCRSCSRRRPTRTSRRARMRRLARTRGSSPAWTLRGT